MLEQDRPRQTRPALGWAAFGSLGLAALGVGIPILWDLYKTRSALELRETNRTVVVGRAAGMEKLQLAYNGEQVASVTKIDLTLTNTGRTPIRAGDFVSPLTITVARGRVLDVAVNAVAPTGVEVQTLLDSAHRAVWIRFPLLNPDDRAHLSLLTAGDAPLLGASARVAGLSQLTFVPRADRASRPKRELGWSFWVVAVFTSFSIVLVLSGLHVNGEEDATARLWKADALWFPASGTPADILSYVDRAFRSSTKSSELATLLQRLRSLPREEPLEHGVLLGLREEFGRAVTDVSSARAGLWFLSLVSAAGLFYIGIKIFSAWS